MVAKAKSNGELLLPSRWFWRFVPRVEVIMYESSFSWGVPQNEHADTWHTTADDDAEKLCGWRLDQRRSSARARARHQPKSDSRKLLVIPSE